MNNTKKRKESNMNIYDEEEEVEEIINNSK